MALSTIAFGLNSMTNPTINPKKSKNVKAAVFRAINGNPVQNLKKVIEMMGGIKNFIGADDIVVIKPNLQWWNHGAPNISAAAALVSMIMKYPGGFSGEVILAENCHRGASPWKSDGSGWAHLFERNSGLEGIKNYNDLSIHLKKKYQSQITICHWIDVDDGARRVYGPNDGIGYVYCDGTGGIPLISYNNGENGRNFREVIMTYPIFKTDSGTMIDFKNGVWENGSYTEQPLKFINFAALNHHSSYCGATCAIKNYLGVSDLSGGADPQSNGKLTKKHHNFHSFPFNKWSAGPTLGMIGAEVGIFLNTIRRADLNIISAEWVGITSRVQPPLARTRAIVASTDPVALDYHASKYLLAPNSKIWFHNPDNPKSPLHQYLKKCEEHDGGVFNEKYVAIRSYDFMHKKMQNDNELTVLAEKIWGTHPKSLLKYFLYRLNIS